MVRRRISSIEQVPPVAPLHEVVSVPLTVVEGVESVWYYHLRRSDPRVCDSLCGRTVFSTEIPLTGWGTVSHLKERWCKDCEKIAREQPDGCSGPGPVESQRTKEIS